MSPRGDRLPPSAITDADKPRDLRRKVPGTRAAATEGMGMLKFALLGALAGVIALPVWGLVSGQYGLEAGAFGGVVGGLVGGTVWGIGARLGQRATF
jgi:hypothetical protein